MYVDATWHLFSRWSEAILHDNNGVRNLVRFHALDEQFDRLDADFSNVREEDIHLIC